MKKVCKNCGSTVEIRCLTEGLIHSTGFYACRQKDTVAEIQGMDGIDHSKSSR